MTGMNEWAHILCRSFTPKRHRPLWVKDLPKIPTWHLERDSNPRPIGWKASNLPMCHHALRCSHIIWHLPTYWSFSESRSSISMSMAMPMISAMKRCLVFVCPASDHRLTAACSLTSKENIYTDITNKLNLNPLATCDQPFMRNL